MFLARHIVLFDSNQIFWSCCETLKSESSVYALPPLIETVPNLRHELNPNRTSPKHRESEVYRYWLSVVETNTHGILRREIDRLDSVKSIVSALLSMLRADVPDLEYHVGLWNKDMLRGLLWTSSSSVKTKRTLDINHPGLVPSWSWASNGAPVSYCFAPGLKNIEAKANLLKVISVDEFQPYLLCVSALSKEVSNGTIGIDGFDFFFDAVDESTLPDDIYKDEERSMNAGVFYGVSCLTLILVAPWTFRPSLKVLDSRWAGLMLERRNNSTFTRKGAFLGATCDKALDGWERKELRII